MSKIGALKMLCSHPQLVFDSAMKFNKQEGEGSAYCAELVNSGLLDGVNYSPKLQAVTEYVKDFLNLDPNNKVVIFATHVRMVDLLVEALDTFKSVTYTGLLTAKQKEDNKIAFNTEPSVRALISSDAGGYGVDLPAGNLLINYDLPWSAGTANQRNGRIVRASSTFKSVVILDVLIAGSVEVRQHQALSQKNAIASAVIDGKGINEKGGVEMTLASLNNFLQVHSVY